MFGQKKGGNFWDKVGTFTISAMQFFVALLFLLVSLYYMLSYEGCSLINKNKNNTMRVIKKEVYYYENNTFIRSTYVVGKDTITISEYGSIKSIK